MALVETPICDFQSEIHDFELMGIDENTYTLEDIEGENGTLIMFICNHCPYVQGIIDDLVEDVEQLQDMGIGVAAIMSNDTENYPADSFENMQAFAHQHDITFPYLIDETQEVAKIYGAVCTPDFFGYNDEGILQYRGRFVDTGKEVTSDSTHELLNAMSEVANSGQGPKQQQPSMGCSIKWYNDAA